ncbi:MAG: ABC transporter substrate-binding protein [Candidatus Limiplasma sp.]|nr:ABC transporter substrate-binding protein [Candidatus Limiplasma sp.]
MKKILALVMALSLALLAVPGLAEMKEFTYVVPRTVESLEDSPFHIAIKLLEKEGYTMHIQEAFGTTDSKMVATNQAQFCGPGPLYVLSAIAEGLPLKAVIGYDAINIWGIGVLSTSPIQSFEDMIGAQEKYGHKLTVALGDPSWEMLITPTLLAAGVDVANDLEFVVAGENRYVQVAEGKLDMLFTWPGECWQLQGQNYDFVYIDGNEVLKTNSNPLVTSTMLIETEPELVQAFVTAMQKAIYAVHYKPEAAAAIMADVFPNIDVTWKAAKYIQEGRNYQMFGKPGSETEARILSKIGFNWEDTWQLNVQAALDSGTISEPLTMEQIYTNEFIRDDIDYSEVEAFMDGIDIEAVASRYAAE